MIAIVLTREERKMLLKLAGRGYDRAQWRGHTLARRVLGKVRDADGFRPQTMELP